MSQHRLYFLIAAVLLTCSLAAPAMADDFVPTSDFGFKILDVAPCNGRVGIKIQFGFPDAGYRIVDKGQITVSNDPFNRNITIDAKVTHTTGLAGQAITLQNVIYDLGALPFEKYKLILKSYGETVDVATLLIPQNVPATGNPIDNNRFFVTQQYRDILGRDPDLVGLDFWTRQLDQCGANADCLRRARVNIALSFFASKEFQDTGFYVYRINRVVGTYPPSFDTYQQLLAKGRDGLVGGELDADRKIELNKQAYAYQVAFSPTFRTAFDSLSNADFVDTLFSRAGFTPTANERNELINGLNNGTLTRADVLRRIAENPVFVQQQFNSLFVLLQYFVFLHRNPSDPPDRDMSGYTFWLNVLNQLGDSGKFQIVKAFIESPEYRSRFCLTE